MSCSTIGEWNKVSDPCLESKEDLSRAGRGPLYVSACVL